MEKGWKCKAIRRQYKKPKSDRDLVHRMKTVLPMNEIQIGHPLILIRFLIYHCCILGAYIRDVCMHCTCGLRCIGSHNIAKRTIFNFGFTITWSSLFNNHMFCGNQTGTSALIPHSIADVDKTSLTREKESKNNNKIRSSAEKWRTRNHFTNESETTNENYRFVRASQRLEEKAECRCEMQWLEVCCVHIGNVLHQ